MSDFDLVKDAITIKRYLTDCGYTTRGNRVKATWRGGETSSPESRLNPEEEKCRNALMKICGAERPIPPELFDEALAIVMRKYSEKAVK